MTIRQEALPLLAKAQLEPGKAGGTFARWNAGGLGLADSQAIENQLRAVGAVWCSVRSQETGWGDKVSAQAIFPWPLDEAREAVAQFLKEEEEQLFTSPGKEVGTVEICSPVTGEPNEGQQRWRRHDGAKQLFWGKGESRLWWRDLRAPSRGWPSQEAGEATPEEWVRRISEANGMVLEEKNKILKFLASL